MATGITLNGKRKRLFHDSGLRIGVQEIARYRWTESELESLAALLADIVSSDKPVDSLRPRALALARHNTFADDMQLLDSPDTNQN